MPVHNEKIVWKIKRPDNWPIAPSLMSFSTLSDLESCPRKWALSHANYPDIWKGRGYPRIPNQSMLEGTIVHLSIEEISKALVINGCPSLQDESAITTLRELGGFSKVVGNCTNRILKSYGENPRGDLILENIRINLESRIPELRLRVQRLLSRINYDSSSMRRGVSNQQSDGNSRNPLIDGTHPEVELRAPELGWHGVADLITISTETCEIRDFKTGDAKKDHEFQLHIYALLWARDQDLNPASRLADKLILSYDDCDVQVPVPGAGDLCKLEDELKKRTETALADIQLDPPEARPSIENCKYCAVRQLCEDFWIWNSKLGVNGAVHKEQYSDFQIKLLKPHGPMSWDGIIEISSNYYKKGLRILMHFSKLRFNLQSGQRIRLINVRVEDSNEETSNEDIPVIVTLGLATELYLI